MLKYLAELGLNKYQRIFMEREFCFHYHDHLNQKPDSKKYAHPLKEQKPIL